MYIIAHRGDSDFHKDNTLAAFQSAIDKKFHIIELDIQLTLDNNIIVYHDTFIQDKLIRNITLSEVQKYDGDIITLNDFFKKIDIDKINIYLDIKGTDFICIYLHKILKDIPQKDKILIGSFNFKLLERLSELDQNYNLGLITENVFDNNILQYYIHKINIAFVSFHWSVLNHQSIHFLHENNTLVFTYTCKHKNIQSFIKDYDVDGIVSNYKF